MTRALNVNFILMIIFEVNLTVPKIVGDKRRFVRFMSLHLMHLPKIAPTTKPVLERIPYYYYLRGGKNAEIDE